ncbi:MAG TPA: TonB-dependent receptor [Longimicrobium sp.]
MFLHFALALAVASAPADTVPTGAVRGVVQSDRSGLPVAMAVVEVRNGAAHPAARSITDSTGAYELRGISPGRHTLRVHHLEHTPLAMEVLVPGGGVVTLDLALRYRPLALDTVRARRPGEIRMGDTVAAERQDVAWVDSRALEEGPGLDKALANPPEGSDPPDPGEVFHVRGSAADLKLVLLDGAPVYAPFHMGGLMDAFEPGVLRSARLYLGGAPARFDGGLSYVMDLATRGGNSERHSLAGSVDVVSSRGVLEGPLPRGATYLVSGRVVHGAWMRGLEGDDFPYLYKDGVARVDVPLAGGVLRATGFANQEGATADRDRSFAGWQNVAGSVRYRGGRLGQDGELTVAGGGFTAALRHYGNHVLRQRGLTERARVALDLGRSAGAVRLRYGAAYEYTRLRYEVDEAALGWSPLVRTHTYGGATAVYVDATWQPSARVSLRGGVRGDSYRYSPRTTLSPRGSVTWLVGDRAALTLAAGRYHQYVRTRIFSDGDPPPSFADSVRRNVASELVVASANHVSVGLDQELADGVRLGVEGFYKRFRDVPTLPGKAAYNSGMELWVRRGTGRLTGWIGYTLTWAWSLEDDGLSADDIVGRQVLSAGLATPLGRAAKLSARFQYGSGLSASRILPGSTDRSAFRTESQNALATASEPLLAGSSEEPYLRLDAELSRTWTPLLAGRRTELTPYFRVINALDQREPLFYQPGPDGEDSRTAVGGFPILPVLGVTFRF